MAFKEAHICTGINEVVSENDLESKMQLLRVKKGATENTWDVVGILGICPLGIFPNVFHP